MTRTVAPPCAMIALGLFLLWQTLDFTSSYSASSFYGPAFFPRLVLGGLILVSLLQLVHALRAHVRDRSARTGSNAEASAPRDRLDIAAFAITLGAAVLYVVGMQYLGFLPATLIFQALIFGLVFRMRNLQGLVLLPGLLTTIYFLVFLRVLELPLPQGQGMFRELSRLIYY